MIMRINYTTIKGNKYPLDLFIKEILVKDLVFEPRQVKDMCRDGCTNYGRSGGCPPRSPVLNELYSLNLQTWLIACLFNSEYKPDRVKQSNNCAIHWKFQDVILARFLNNLGHALQANIGGGFLATGYCMGCPGKKCSYKLGLEHCRNPQKRTYSMEATGINVVKTLKNSFDIDVYWYSKGNTNIPYMVKCMSFFPKCAEDANNSVLAVLPYISSVDI